VPQGGNVELTFCIDTATRTTFCFRVKNGADGINIVMRSSSGTTLDNGDIKTDLSVEIYYSSQLMNGDDSTAKLFYVWKKDGEALSTIQKIVYETIDFASSINTAINDLEHTLNLVNLSINDIKRLKEKYINDFSKYSSSSIEYNEVIKKINKIENSLLNNKIKIQLIHEGMKEKAKENDKKMKMVKKLNCSSNN
jgi:DNA repair ATPase RecN